MMFLIASLQASLPVPLSLPPSLPPSPHKKSLQLLVLCLPCSWLLTLLFEANLPEKAGLPRLYVGGFVGGGREGERQLRNLQGYTVLFGRESRLAKRTHTHSEFQTLQMQIGHARALLAPVEIKSRPTQSA